MIKKALIITPRDPTDRKAGDVNRLRTLVDAVPRDMRVYVIVLRAKHQSIDRVVIDSRHVVLIKFCPLIISLITQILFNTFRLLPIQCAVFFPFSSRKIYEKLEAKIQPSLVVYHLFRSVPINKLSLVMPKFCVLDMCDLQSLNYDRALKIRSFNLVKRIFLKYEFFTTRILERKLASVFATVSFISQPDAEAFKKKLKSSQPVDVKVAGNFTFQECAPNLKGLSQRSNFALVGNFTAWHNMQQINMLLSMGILDHCHEIGRDIKLIGSMSEKQERNFRKHGFITVRSPDQIEKHLLDCDVGLCIPLASAGFQTKLYDYILSKLVILCTQQVANAAGLSDGISCIIYEGPASVEKVLGLSMEQKLEIVNNAEIIMNNSDTLTKQSWQKIFVPIVK